MRRKSFWLSVALVVLIAGTVLTTLVLLTQHEPAFYTRSAVPPGPQRKDISGRFQGRSLALLTSIRAGGSRDGNWGGTFSEEELNSYFEEHFLAWGLADELLPEGVSEPRVAFEQDRLRFGFRYGMPPLSTIVSIDFRVWLAQAEPNVVVLELKGVHAGSLPITAQSLLENISEALRRHNVQVAWYRHQGNPTAAVKFQTDQPRPAFQLLRLDLKPGMLTVVGHSNEPLQDFTPTALAPTGN